MGSSSSLLWGGSRRPAPGGVVGCGAGDEGQKFTAVLMMFLSVIAFLLLFSFATILSLEPKPHALVCRKLPITGDKFLLCLHFLNFCGIDASI